MKRSKYLIIYKKIRLNGGKDQLGEIINNYEEYVEYLWERKGIQGSQS